MSESKSGLLTTIIHRTLWSLLKAQKANGENNWEKSLPTLILVYNDTQHYSTLCSPACIFLGRETNLPYLSLLPNFMDDSDPPPPASHTGGETGSHHRPDEKK